MDTLKESQNGVYVVIGLPVGVPYDSSSVRAPRDHNAERLAGSHASDRPSVPPQVSHLTTILQTLWKCKVLHSYYIHT